MSRKVDPRGLRIGVTQPWTSQWYAENDNYADNLIEDDRIRTYLKKQLRRAGLDSIKIERSIKQLKITIAAARPGVVIGRKGSGLTEIRKVLKIISKAEIDLQIEEVKKPEASAEVIAENIAMQLERRMSAKRAINIAADKAVDAGVIGVRIQVKGTIYGPNSIATRVQALRGAIPTQTLRANISYAKATALTRGGSLGIKVWINKE